MLSLIAWSLFAFAGFVLSTALYAVVQAIVGRAFGIEVERVGIGLDYFGKAVARWQGRHWEWVIGIAPLGSFTKFRSSDDDEYTEHIREDGILKGVRVVEFSKEDDAEHAAKPPRPGTYQAASLPARVLIMLSGPISSALLGVALLTTAVALGEPQLRLSAAAESDIIPCSVGGLTLSDQPTDWQGQVTLFRDLATGASRRFLWTAPRGDWGGLFSFVITSGAAAKVSLGAGLSCMGALICGMAAFNLLPLGVLNGGHIINACLGAIVGQKRYERVAFLYALLSLPCILMLMARLFIYDLAWLWSLRG